MDILCDGFDTMKEIEWEIRSTCVKGLSRSNFFSSSSSFVEALRAKNDFCKRDKRFIVLDVRRDKNKDFPLKALGFYQRSKLHVREFSSAFIILLPCVHLP